MRMSITISSLEWVVSTYAVMECVAVPIPCIEQLHAATVILGPRVAIDQRSVQSESSDTETQEDNRSSLSDERPLTETNAPYACCSKIVHLTQSHDRKVQSREIVMQEKLSLHEEEREVVERPAQDSDAKLVVETLELYILVIVVVPLPSENGKSLE